MSALVHGERTLTDLDHVRLTKLLSQQSSSPLAGWLEGADVTSARDVPADRVTMYSRVEVVDAHTRCRQVFTICYPADAVPTAGFISVLSPVGASLLGLQVGDVARWLAPDGEACAAQIAAVHYQPEAAGDYVR